MTSNQFPGFNRTKPDRGKLIYNGQVLIKGNWKLVGYYYSIYKQDPTLNKKLLKRTY